MKTPSVSVILPNYNYAQFFSSRLDEVLSQSYPVSEIIILDDASTDASVSCINTKLAKIKDDYPAINFKTGFNSKNSGSVFSQWQKGIELAESDYIWIAELDDSAESTFLETAIAPIENDSNIVLSYTNSRLIGSVSIKDRLRVAYDFMRTKRSINGYVTTGATEVEKSLAVFNSIPNVPACIIKNLPNLSKILDGSKGFKLSGDWYLYLNLLTQGKIAYSPKKLNAHRLSKTSVTSQTDLKIRFREMQTIHTLATDLYDLSDSTKARIKKTEDSLRTSWGIA